MIIYCRNNSITDEIFLFFGFFLLKLFIFLLAQEKKLGNYMKNAEGEKV